MVTFYVNLVDFGLEFVLDVEGFRGFGVRISGGIVFKEFF